MSNPHWCTYCQGRNAHNCQFNTQLPRMHTYTTTHTTPPQRTWVGLTDEEIDYIYMGIRAVHHDVDSDVLCRAIEAKLKEKNT